MGNNEMSFATRAVHAGNQTDPITGAVVAPVHISTTYVFDHDKMERFLSGDMDMYFYSRNGNPTQDTYQEKIASLEGGEACLAVSSGMAAITTAIMSVVNGGDHIIAGKTIYGSTYSFITKVLSRYGVTLTVVDDMKVETINAAKTPATKLLYFESEYNPTLEVPDVEVLVNWAKENNITTIVDNTFLSPYLFRPIEWGVDICVNSTTKYISGHGDQIGGVITSTKARIDDMINNLYGFTGPFPAPQSVYLAMRGVKTLPLRMKAHCENALIFAKTFEKHPMIERVIYPGLESHPNYEIAKKQLENGFGGMVVLCIKGDKHEARKVCESLKIVHYCASLGDLDTMVETPATMTHSFMSQEMRSKMGVGDGMIRVSIGVEGIEDIVADFNQAFETISK